MAIVTAGAISGLPSHPTARRTPDHPPYAEMIQAAIRTLAEDGGSTAADIDKYIRAEFHDLPWGHRNLFPHYLRKIVLAGEITETEHGRYAFPSVTPAPIPQGRMKSRKGEKSKKPTPSRKRRRKSFIKSSVTLPDAEEQQLQGLPAAARGLEISPPVDMPLIEQPADVGHPTPYSTPQYEPPPVAMPVQTPPASNSQGEQSLPGTSWYSPHCELSVEGSQCDFDPSPIVTTLACQEEPTNYKQAIPVADADEEHIIEEVPLQSMSLISKIERSSPVADVDEEHIIVEVPLQSMEPTSQLEQSNPAGDTGEYHITEEVPLRSMARISQVEQGNPVVDAEEEHITTEVLLQSTVPISQMEHSSPVVDAEEDNEPITEAPSQSMELISQMEQSNDDPVNQTVEKEIMTMPPDEDNEPITVEVPLQSVARIDQLEERNNGPMNQTVQNETTIVSDVEITADQPVLQSSPLITPVEMFPLSSFGSGSSMVMPRRRGRPPKKRRGNSPSQKTTDTGENSNHILSIPEVLMASPLPVAVPPPDVEMVTDQPELKSSPLVTPFAEMVPLPSGGGRGSSSVFPKKLGRSPKKRGKPPSQKPMENYENSNNILTNPEVLVALQSPFTVPPLEVEIVTDQPELQSLPLIAPAETMPLLNSDGNGSSSALPGKPGRPREKRCQSPPSQKPTESGDSSNSVLSNPEALMPSQSLLVVPPDVEIATKQPKLQSSSLVTPVEMLPLPSSGDNGSSPMLHKKLGRPQEKRRGRSASLKPMESGQNNSSVLSNPEVLMALPSPLSLPPPEGNAGASLPPKRSRGRPRKQRADTEYNASMESPELSVVPPPEVENVSDQPEFQSSPLVTPAETLPLLNNDGNEPSSKLPKKLGRTRKKRCQNPPSQKPMEAGDNSNSLLSNPEILMPLQLLFVDPPPEVDIATKPEFQSSPLVTPAETLPLLNNDGNEPSSKLPKKLGRTRKKRCQNPPSQKPMEAGDNSNSLLSNPEILMQLQLLFVDPPPEVDIATKPEFQSSSLVIPAEILSLPSSGICGSLSVLPNKLCKSQELRRGRSASLKLMENGQNNSTLISSPEVLMALASPHSVPPPEGNASASLTPKRSRGRPRKQRPDTEYRGGMISPELSVVPSPEVEIVTDQPGLQSSPLITPAEMMPLLSNGGNGHSSRLPKKHGRRQKKRHGNPPSQKQIDSSSCRFSKPEVLMPLQSLLVISPPEVDISIKQPELQSPSLATPAKMLSLPGSGGCGSSSVLHKKLGRPQEKRRGRSASLKPVGNGQNNSSLLSNPEVLMALASPLSVPPPAGDAGASLMPKRSRGRPRKQVPGTEHKASVVSPELSVVPSPEVEIVTDQPELQSLPLVTPAKMVPLLKNDGNESSPVLPKNLGGARERRCGNSPSQNPIETGDYSNDVLSNLEVLMPLQSPSAMPPPDVEIATNQSELQSSSLVTPAEMLPRPSSGSSGSSAVFCKMLGIPSKKRHGGPSSQKLLGTGENSENIFSSPEVTKLPLPLAVPPPESNVRALPTPKRSRGRPRKDRPDAGMVSPELYLVSFPEVEITTDPPEVQISPLVTPAMMLPPPSNVFKGSLSVLHKKPGKSPKKRRGKPPNQKPMESGENSNNSNPGMLLASPLPLTAPSPEDNVGASQTPKHSRGRPPKHRSDTENNAGVVLPELSLVPAPPTEGNAGVLLMPKHGPGKPCKYSFEDAYTHRTPGLVIQSASTPISSKSSGNGDTTTTSNLQERLSTDESELMASHSAGNSGSSMALKLWERKTLADKSDLLSAAKSDPPKRRGRPPKTKVYEG